MHISRKSEHCAQCLSHAAPPAHGEHALSPFGVGGRVYSELGSTSDLPKPPPQLNVALVAD